MNLLAPYMLWIKLAAIAALCAALFGYGYHTGTKHVQAQWDAEKVAQQAEAAKQEQINRAKELSYQQKVIEAQNANQDRIKKLQVTVAAARSESDGLRNDLTAINAKLSTASADSVRNYAITANAILGECQSNYRDMAEKADGHASDVKLLIDAWPK